MNIWQVLVSSPSDVRDERESLTRVVHTVNLALEASGKQIRLQLRKWETDVPPGLHEQGGQGQIESTLHFGDCDILIGIFWKRFGTPVLGKLSGTEREIRLGCEAWRSSRRPNVMVFFCTAAHQSRNREELEQFSNVLAFEEELKSEGLVQEYSDAREFEALAIRYLLIVCLGATEAQRYLSSPIECSVLGSHVVVRIEGQTERVGDLQLFFSIDHAFAMAAIKNAKLAGLPSPDVDLKAWMARPLPAPLLVDIEVALSNEKSHSATT